MYFKLVTNFIFFSFDFSKKTVNYHNFNVNNSYLNAFQSTYIDKNLAF